jgi:hypothetical protein
MLLNLLKKIYGKDDEYPGEHIAMVHDISNICGHDEAQKHYYFLKLFPFSLRGKFGIILCLQNPSLMLVTKRLLFAYDCHKNMHAANLTNGL